MRTGVIAGSLLYGLVLVAAPLQAQQVSADVVVRGGPVAGRVVVGDGYSTYRRRPAVYRYAAPRAVVIERVHRDRHHRHWKRHGFRPVTVYYANGRYYDRWHGHPHRVQRVVVYERDGRYYEGCDHDDDRNRDWDD
ncbi:MAG: hypothetical protein H0T68_14495 [Gemmatimonadales bacterium]|nr:hypothetical protein [Gemmatimonadales bacterium]